MSSPPPVPTPQPIDSKRDQFRKYVENNGVVEMFSKVLVELMNIPEKPDNAIDFIRENLGATMKEKMQIDHLQQEVESYRKQVEDLKRQLELATKHSGGGIHANGVEESAVSNGETKQQVEDVLKAAADSSSASIDVAEPTVEAADAVTNGEPVIETAAPVKSDEKEAVAAADASSVDAVTIAAAVAAPVTAVENAKPIDPPTNGVSEEKSETVVAVAAVVADAAPSAVASSEAVAEKAVTTTDEKAPTAAIAPETKVESAEAASKPAEIAVSAN